MNKNLKQLIENFNFVKVHTTMVHLDWHWSEYENVPTVGQMVIKVMSMFDDLNTSNDTNLISTGGFTIEKINSHYKLFFAVDEWESD